MKDIEEEISYHNLRDLFLQTLVDWTRQYLSLDCTFSMNLLSGLLSD